jgi:hypothetical protein
MIKSTHFFAVLLILGSSLIHGQDSANPGNGLLFNPLDRDVDLIVKPITGDAEEKEFKIAPGSRIELQQYKSYDIFIPSAKDVYRLDVSKESTADSGKSYFSFEEESGKVVLRNGIPNRVFTNAWKKALESTQQIQTKWTTRRGESGTTLSGSVMQRWLLEAYTSELRESLGCEFAILEDKDAFLIVFHGCKPKPELEMLGNHIRDAIFEGEPGMKTEVIGLCCSNQNGVSLEEIREILKESDAQPVYNNAPRITIDPWGGNVNLGEIEGLDNTKSELDMLSKNVRQFDFMISTPSFDFLKNRSDQIQQCLLIQACILNNPTLPSEIDMKDFRLALQVCLDHLYACAFVDSDSFPKQLLWELDSSNPIQITHRCKFSEDGKVLVETRTLYSAAAARAYSITIKYEDAVNGVRVRGIGWRTMEQLHNREFGYWDNVPEGKDGYNWKAGEYEVEIELKNGTKKKIADAFKPIPDPSIEEERTWIFLPSKWKSN